MTSKSRVCVSSISFTVAALCGQLQLIRRGRMISLQESRALLRSRTSRDRDLGCREMKDTPQRPSLRQHYIFWCNLGCFAIERFGGDWLAKSFAFPWSHLWNLSYFDIARAALSITSATSFGCET